MKNLIVFLLAVMSGQAIAQVPVAMVPVVPVVVQVPVTQPVVVQEMKLWPIIENKVVYQQQVWPVYYYQNQMPVIYPVIDQRDYRYYGCGFFRWY